MMMNTPVCYPVYIVDDDAVNGLEIGRRLRAVGITNQVFAPVQHFLEVAHRLPVGSIVLEAPLLTGEGTQLRHDFEAIGMPIICLAETDRPRADGQCEPDKPKRCDGTTSLARERINMLSPRERQVLGLLVAGRSTKAMATELGLSPRTIETHRSRLLKHLKVRCTAQAIKLAVEAGL